MVKLTWFGHATWQLEISGSIILVDPFLTNNPAASCKPDELNPQFILVTHGHGDHVEDLVSIAKRTGATVICNYEIYLWLEKQGVKNVQPLNFGGAVKLPFGKVKMTYAQHSSSLPDGTYGGNSGGYLITTNEGKKIYIAGDTSIFGDMRMIGDVGLDLAVLPIGDVYTMDVEESLLAIDLLRPKKVLPSHYDTWPPIAQDAQAWATAVGHQTNSQATVLKPGESLEV
jgi:L-ascorbate metabolism protein UlaG (beta-lactamase superfamily)